MEYVFGFVLLLGVLIFIHELGHFLAGKAVGVRVETFSIGMGKKILQFTKGETTYALSLLPLGGYVKVTGQDPREEVPPELESRSYRSKALWKRALIVAAGPLFNAILAVLVFIGLMATGLPSLAPQLARVLPDSPAAEAGFQSGDIVRAVTLPTGDVRKIRERSDLEQVLAQNVGQSLVFTIDRASTESRLAYIEAGTAEKAPAATTPPSASEVERLNLAYTPALGRDRDSTLGLVQERGVIAGVEYGAFAPIAALRPESWAAQRLVPSPFVIIEIQFTDASGSLKALRVSDFDQLVLSWRTAVEASAASAGKLTLRGYRVDDLKGAQAEGTATRASPPEAPEVQTLHLAWSKASEKPSASLEQAGLFPAELMILSVVPNSPAEKLGLRSGDVLQELDGRPIQSFSSFRENIQTLASADRPLVVSFLRDGKRETAELRPKLVDVADPLTETKQRQFQIGAQFLANSAEPLVTLVKAESVGEAIALGWTKTVGLTSTMLESFYHLATGSISPKTLGGPILIAKISGESFKQGPVPFLRMMAFISLNLFILNLLPIPVLDGGHLVLIALEAVRRKPLSIRIIEAWTTAGFFLLMGLVAIVFFNDLSRIGLFKFLNL